MAGAGLVRPRRSWGWAAWPAVALLLSTAAPASDVRTVWPNMRGEIYSRSRALVQRAGMACEMERVPALGMRVDSLARWIATDPGAHFRPHGAR